MPNLRIRLIEARNLQNKDSGSLSDPYVIFSVGKERAKSFVVKNSMNPLWNQSFTLRITDVSQPLQIQLYDRDFLKRDDSLGSVDVNLAHLHQGKEQDMWLNLSGRRNQGQIHISLFPEDFGKVFTQLYPKRETTVRRTIFDSSASSSSSSLPPTYYPPSYTPFQHPESQPYHQPPYQGYYFSNESPPSQNHTAGHGHTNTRHFPRNYGY